MPSRTTRGLWYGVGAFTIWGLFPIYWKLIGHVPAQQVIAHRLAWSFVVLATIVAFLRRGASRAAGVGARALGLRAMFRQGRRVLGLYAVAGGLISLNWFIYVWAVEHGFVLETSLGYFLTPLVNVLLGVAVLRERLRPTQWVAVAVAAAGVIDLVFAYGRLPRIALGLAVTFGSYGLVKKRAPLDPLDGMMLETGILFVPAVAYLLATEAGGTGAFGHTGAGSDLLMAGAGIVTTVPLLMFATAVQRVPLSAIGLLQFIAPTIQFFLGVLVYREPFSRAQSVGFGMVWLALVIFVAGNSKFKIQDSRFKQRRDAGKVPDGSGLR